MKNSLGKKNLCRASLVAATTVATGSARAKSGTNVVADAHRSGVASSRIFKEILRYTSKGQTKIYRSFEASADMVLQRELCEMGCFAPGAGIACLPQYGGGSVRQPSGWELATSSGGRAQGVN